MFLDRIRVYQLAISYLVPLNIISYLVPWNIYMIVKHINMIVKHINMFYKLGLDYFFLISQIITGIFLRFSLLVVNIFWNINKIVLSKNKKKCI